MATAKTAVNKLIEGILLAIDKKLNDAPYDRTVQGRIIEILPKNKCKVLVDGKEFKAKTKSSLSVNEVVDICVPQNNLNKMFVIHNGVTSSGGNLEGDTKDCTITFVEPSNDTDVISGDTHSTIVGKFVKNIKTIKSLIGNLTSLKTEGKDNLVSSINEVSDKADLAFQSASNGKALISGAITGKGIPTTPSDTFTQMAVNISDIETGTDTSDATATANDIVAPKTAYVNNEKIVGAIVDRGTVNYSLPINGSYTIPNGKHSGSGKVTQSIPTKSAEIITPSTTNKIIASGQFLSGVQTIKGDANLIGSNILIGKTIFDISGSAVVGLPGLIGEYVVTSDTKPFYRSVGGQPENLWYIQIAGLTAKPRFIVIRALLPQTYAYARTTTVYTQNESTFQPAIQILCFSADYITKEHEPNTSAYVNSTGFLLPILYPITRAQWAVIY